MNAFDREWNTEVPEVRTQRGGPVLDVKQQLVLEIARHYVNAGIEIVHSCCQHNRVCFVGVPRDVHGVVVDVQQEL